MKLPLICVDGYDVNVYATEEEAALDLEPIDIRNGEYRFFDAAGCVVDAYVHGGTEYNDDKKRWYIIKSLPNDGQIRFSKRLPEECQQAELTLLLKDFLKTCKRDADADDLDSLISEIVRFLKPTKK